MIVLPRRLSDEVADRVRALIDEKNLEAGMKLPAERQLAMQLGVSRNSLREALAKLVAKVYCSVDVAAGRLFAGVMTHGRSKTSSSR